MYAPVARAAAQALDPLRTALDDVDACSDLLCERLGYRVRFTQEAHAQLAALLPVADALASLPDMVDALMAATRASRCSSRSSARPRPS